MTTSAQLKSLVSTQLPTNGVGLIQAINARTVLSEGTNNIIDTIFAQSYITPPPASLTKGLMITQSGPTDGSSIPNDIVIDPFIFGYNYIHITGDQGQTTDVRSCVHAFLVDYSFGGANMTGARAAIGAYSTLSAPSSPSNLNTDYIALIGRIDINSSDGGTGTTIGTARGSAFGANLVVASEVTIVHNYLNMCGMEIDFSLNAGTTTRYLSGITVDKVNNDVRGAIVDAGFVVGGNGNCYWNVGFCVSDQNGSVGVAPTGTILGFQAAGSVAQPWAFANGIDLRNAIFSGKVFTSSKFDVDGSGTVTIIPTVNTSNLGLIISQVGSPTDGSSGLTGIHGSGFAYNYVYVQGEQRNQNTVSPYTHGLQVYMDTGGPNSQGTKIALDATINRTAPGNTAVPYGDTIAGNFFAESNSPDGGTVIAPRGTLFGIGVGAVAGPGAVNYFVVSGSEFDVGINTGASSANRLGLSLTSIGDVAATSLDTAIDIGANSVSGLGWQTGFMVTNIHGTPGVISTGTVFGTDGSTNTVANIMDFHTYTVTSNIFNFANFKVTGAGRVSAPWPTSVTGLPTGTLWNNAGVINVAP